MSPGTRAPWRQALLAGALLSAFGTLVAPAVGAHTVVVWSRPLVSALLVLFAASVSQPLARPYQLLVIAGLLGCGAVDVLLAHPTDPFLWALGTSMAALLCCFLAFLGRSAALRYKAGVVGYAAAATVVLALVVPVLGGTVRSAVVAHVIVLALAAAQAASWMLEDLASHAARLAAFGMSCLVAAHAVLALDRFVFIVPARELLVLVPYWIAMACLALSVERPAPPALRL